MIKQKSGKIFTYKEAALADSSTQPSCQSTAQLVSTRHSFRAQNGRFPAQDAREPPWKI